MTENFKATKIEKYFRGIIAEYNLIFTNLDKNKKTLKELNDLSNDFLMNFYYKRKVIHEYIKLDKELFEYFKNLCSKDFLFWIVFDGTTTDLNRNPKNKKQPIIPYNHQISMIKMVSESTKNLHCEKSRRQGASLILAVLYPAWCLFFSENTHNFTTHKDLDSLYQKFDDINSTFGKILFCLKNSIFYDRKQLKQEPNSQSKRLVYSTNSLSGEVLSPNTTVGFQANIIFVDEIDPVCDAYPNKSETVFGAFATSVNRMIIFSTYRSINYPFYKIKEKYDDSTWDFVVLDWKDHPLCNLEWYNLQCSKMGSDPVLIARELDHNPTMAIKGRVFHRLNDDNFKDDLSQYFNLNKLIMADFGGGTSATALIYCFYDTSSKKMILYKALKTTKMDAKDIRKFTENLGFWGVKIVGDRSASSQGGAYRYDWKTLLTEEGFIFAPVDNTKMEGLRSLINLAFLNNEIIVNSEEPNFRDLWTYTYKNDGINKNDSSHLGDALCYGYRYLYENAGFELGMLD